MEKFQCKNCGKCCEDFGGGYLPLFPWEANELIKLAKERDIELDIRPIWLNLDKKSNMAFYCDLGLYNQPCPFLENNKCSIYEKRPTACLSFPILFNQSTKTLYIANCFNFDVTALAKELTENLTNKELRNKRLIGVFGEDSYYAYQRRHFFSMNVENNLMNLIQDKKVKLRKISRFDYNRYNHKFILDLFVEKGLIDEQFSKKFIFNLMTKENFKKYMGKIEL